MLPISVTREAFEAGSEVSRFVGMADEVWAGMGGLVKEMNLDQC